MTVGSMPSILDDFVVTTNGCDDEACGPDAIGMAALALLHLKASARPTTQILTNGGRRSRNRAILLGGGPWSILRCMLTGSIRLDPDGVCDPGIVRMRGEDILYAWTSYGTA